MIKRTKNTAAETAAEHYGLQAKVAYEAALRGIAHVSPQIEVPKLSFGGVSRYGRLLAYYQPKNNTIVVPTDNQSMSIATLLGDQRDVVRTSDATTLVRVLVHELMHAADQQHFERDRHDPHATTGWCTLVAAFEALRDPKARSIRVETIQTIVDWAREGHLQSGHPAGRLRQLVGLYEPPVSEEGGLVPSASPLLATYSEAVEALLRRENKLAKCCSHCGEEFFPKRKDAEFCSAACRTAAHRALPEAEQERRKAERHAKAVSDARLALEEARKGAEHCDAEVERLLRLVKEIRDSRPARLAAVAKAEEALAKLTGERPVHARRRRAA